jgi:hypothetical protein
LIELSTISAEVSMMLGSVHNSLKRGNSFQYLFQLMSHITLVHTEDRVSTDNILREIMVTLLKVAIIEQLPMFHNQNSGKDRFKFSV